MPGVGKTRMMEQIWKEAIEKKIIKKVIRADVGNEDLSDKQVIIKLQQKIAGYLDCHFKSEDIVEHRASQLKDSLKNSLEDGGKILVIFDDVWSEIPLSKIGIPSDDGSISKGCKILFTSRQENVCKKNKCDHPVMINILEDVEAWNLFRNTVGTSTIDSLQDQSLAMARRVCNKCANLPPLIHAVGKALKFNSHNSLEGALYQFANCDIRYIQGIDPKVYAYLPAVENLPKNDTAFQNFESRKDVYKKLWEALVTEGNSLILGIYGMPGVGKTRMREQISNDAMEMGIFAKVTQAAVGNKDFNANQAIIDLQNQIARNLDCKFELQDDVDQRASRLKSTLMDGSKILIIFDDVWSQIPLKKIGITSDDGSISKGCKILFTSRQENVCKKNKCQHPVEITTLKPDEAWNLFRNTVGNSQMDESLAKEVCNKCGGLPLVIHAVGKALKCEHHDIWEDALDQLNNCRIESIPDIDRQVHVCLKWSFDRLVDEDAKACLLLCSLFPEDADISITVLFHLARGSQLVDGRGRSRVRAMVRLLKSASLLLEGRNDERVKLHDIIRAVARSVAFHDPKYAFLFVKCDSQLQLLDNDNYGTRKLLHLDLERNVVHFPDYPVSPDLQTLWLQCNNKVQQFSGGFFSMFVNLRFLYLESMIFSSQKQFSLQPLGKLRTIILDQCDITGIGENLFPENLETLRIWNCRLPTPFDLPKLECIRKLEILRYYPEVIIMVPNAISGLSSLEELHIPNGFIIWHDEIHRPVPTLGEIIKLTRLTSLRFTFRDYDMFRDYDKVQDTNIFCNLHEFDIYVGDPCYSSQNRNPPVSFERVINLYQPLFDFTSPVDRSEPEDVEMMSVDVNMSSLMGRAMNSLMGRAEVVKLTNVDVKVSSICNNNREAFADLRNLYIEECPTMENLARISQDEIEHSRQPRTSFSKLILLDIRDCPAMKYLLCNSVAKCLGQLEKLYIQSCYLMEAIVMNEGTSDGDIINFSKLKTLILSDLPKLTSFYRGKKDVHSSSTSMMDNSVQFQPLFDGRIAFPFLEKLYISRLQGTSDIWGNHYHNYDLSFCQMKKLEIFDCDKRETVFQLGMLHRLRNLEYLHIKDCNSLRNVFLPSTARDLMHLKEMRVERCKMMSEIIGAGEQDISDDIVFPELTLLELEFLPSLTRFCCYQSREANTYKVVFPNLVEFKLSSVIDIKLEALELDRDDSTCQLTKLYINCDN